MRFPNLPQALEMGLIVAEDNTRDNSVLHVTDLAVTMEGEGCPRQLWLKLRGADKRKLTAGQMLMFWHGHRIHEDLTALLERGLPGEWEITGFEVKLDLLGIVGTADCLIRERQTGDEIVIDYKTIRGRGFNFLEEVKPAHALQVQTYAMALDVAGAMVFYVDREGQNAFKQFVVPRDDSKVIEAIHATKAIRDSLTEPPILEPIIKRGKDTKTKGTPITLAMPWNCDYCQYRDVTCHGALPYDYRQMGVIGHIVDGAYNPSKVLPAEVDKIVVDILRRETD